MTRAISTLSLQPFRDVSIPVWIAGDTLRLEQIINNLVMNALTHAPDSRHLDVSLQRKEQWAELRVEDYGPGIPAVDLPHLFFPYYQASRGAPASQNGLGLGLFIVAELVKAHGGAIAVRSTEGTGTAFIVRFPVSGEQVECADRLPIQRPNTNCPTEACQIEGDLLEVSSMDVSGYGRS